MHLVGYLYEVSDELVKGTLQGRVGDVDFIYVSHL
jgi:hypothetical protein